MRTTGILSERDRQFTPDKQPGGTLSQGRKCNIRTRLQLGGWTEPGKSPLISSYKQGPGNNQGLNINLSPFNYQIMNEEPTNSDGFKKYAHLSDSQKIEKILNLLEGSEMGQGIIGKTLSNEKRITALERVKDRAIFVAIGISIASGFGIAKIFELISKLH